MRRRHAPTWILRRPIAHRGLHGPRRPENSLSAFEAAVDHGYPIELDVHLTSDAQVVVFHDDELRRMTGASGRVTELSLAQLRQRRLLGTDDHVPSLREVLELVDGRVPLVVELKSHGAAGALETRTRDVLRDYAGEVAVQSFNPRSVAWFRRESPHLPRGLLATDFADEDLPTYQKILLRRLAPVPWVAPDYVGYDLRCLPYWPVTLLRRVGVPVVAWTIRTAADAARAAVVADNMIFENVRP